ncbi:hypothetical protein CI102_15379, partial [Trichoderma harzianum]
GSREVSLYYFFLILYLYVKRAAWEIAFYLDSKYRTTIKKEIFNVLNILDIIFLRIKVFAATPNILRKKIKTKLLSWTTVAFGYYATYLSYTAAKRGSFNRLNKGLLSRKSLLSRRSFTAKVLKLLLLNIPCENNKLEVLLLLNPAANSSRKSGYNWFRLQEIIPLKRSPLGNYFSPPLELEGGWFSLLLPKDIKSKGEEKKRLPYY